MSLFKRKTSDLKTQVDISRKIELGQDTIALGSLYLDVEQEGNFYIEDTFTISANACVIGNITASRCIIEGKVIGDIICTEELQLGATAVIKGAIMTKAAIMEAGSVINGKVMLDSSVKVSLLALKIAEARKYLENEDGYISSDITKKTEIPKKEVNTLKEVVDQSMKHPMIIKQNSDYAVPAGDSDNWW